MQFVLSGATQYTQFMDIRGGAAQALKNGGSESIVSVLTRFYDPTQTSTRFSALGGSPPTRITGIFASKQKKSETIFDFTRITYSRITSKLYTAYLEPEVFLVFKKKIKKG